MKRFLSVGFIVAILILGVIYFNQQRLELPFTSQDVKNIELYRVYMPTSAERKIVTSEEDIERIIKILTSTVVKENKLELIYGTTSTTFNFNLKDNTNVIIYFNLHGFMKGAISSPSLFNYHTSRDIGSIWNKYGADHQNVGEDALPTYEK